MLPLVLAESRMQSLGLDIDALSERVEKLKGLGGDIALMAVAIAEGRGMTEGFWFANGSELANFLDRYSLFLIAHLMEKGLLPKRLPKSAQSKDEGETRGYM